MAIIVTAINLIGFKDSKRHKSKNIDLFEKKASDPSNQNLLKCTKIIFIDKLHTNKLWNSQYKLITIFQLLYPWTAWEIHTENWHKLAGKYALFYGNRYRLQWCSLQLHQILIQRDAPPNVTTHIASIFDATAGSTVEVGNDYRRIKRISQTKFRGQNCYSVVLCPIYWNAFCWICFKFSHKKNC